MVEKKKETKNSIEDWMNFIDEGFSIGSLDPDELESLAVDLHRTFDNIQDYPYEGDDSIGYLTARLIRLGIVPGMDEEMEYWKNNKGFREGYNLNREANISNEKELKEAIANVVKEAIVEVLSEDEENKEELGVESKITDVEYEEELSEMTDDSLEFELEYEFDRGFDYSDMLTNVIDRNYKVQKIIDELEKRGIDIDFDLEIKFIYE